MYIIDIGFYHFKKGNFTYMYNLELWLTRSHPKKIEVPYNNHDYHSPLSLSLSY